MLKKKMLLLALAIGALTAFAAPVAAQADSLYSEEEEAPLPEEADVTATSTNLTIHTAIGTLQCGLVTVHMKLEKNGPTVHLSSTATTVEGCNATITDPTGGTVTIGKAVGGFTGMSFTVASFCTFTGTVPFSYATNTDLITIGGANQLFSSVCGFGTVTGSFTLEKADGTPILIS